MCMSRKYSYSPTEGIGISWGGGGFCKTQKFKEMCEALLEFSKGWEVLEKIPSVGEVWIFSGIITHKSELPLKRDIKACVYN